MRGARFPIFIDCSTPCPPASQATAELLRLTAYSYAIGNGDLHGKNYSIHQNGRGMWSVTPAYDLLCTQPYASWNDPMAAVAQE
nr:HipA domain-containing protein [Rhodococcus sp. EPR-157]